MGAIRTLLNAAFLLDPVSIFLYTWQFLKPLEGSENSPACRCVYRYFRILSVLLVPPAFVILVTGIVITIGKQYQYATVGDMSNYYIWQHTYQVLFKTVGYLTTIVNCCSSLI